MGSVNKAFVLGNLTADAELRSTGGGTPVSTFTVATNDVWTDGSGQRQERAEFHRIVFWGPSAEAIAPYMKKGREVHVEGQIQTRKWTDNEGNDRFTTEIKAYRVQLCGPRVEEQAPQAKRNEWSPDEEAPF